MNFELIPETDSTNNELRRRSSEGMIEHGFCLATNYQSHGHGQADNQWESERGKNLLFSILLHPIDIEASQQFVITELVTLALIDSLQKEIDDEITIKWPNDIYVGEKKLCGILIENTLCGSVLDTSIIGIGININQETFTSDAPNPVSLCQLSGHTHNCDAIIRDIHKKIILYYTCYADNIGQKDIRKKLHDEYMSHIYRRSGFHRYSTPEGNSFFAEIVGIGSQGHLSLRKKNGETLQFAFKEVIFVNEKI